MDLGEQIELHGFVEDEYGELIIVKKLIGNHVKKLIEREPGFERLVLTLERGSRVTIDGALTVSGTPRHASVTDDNIFFAIDRCLKALGRS